MEYKNQSAFTNNFCT